MKDESLWKHFCKLNGFSEKLFKDISWFTNYKYYAFHLLAKHTTLNKVYMKKCCNFKESLNLLIISGFHDGRERILQQIDEPNTLLNVRSQFSQHTGLTKTTFRFYDRQFNAISFYYHILLTFPTYLPSFPMSESYRDIIIWMIDGTRVVNPIPLSPDSQLADVIYNQRYFHYIRKTLHILLSSVAPWVPLFVVVTNQQNTNAISNIEIIKQLKLWREHRIWRVFSLEPTEESLRTLYTHCINEVNHIRYYLSTMIYCVF